MTSVITEMMTEVQGNNASYVTIRYLLSSRRQPSAVLWYPFRVLRPIPSYHSSTKCASKKYEKYPNISFSPCQTGQGRRFRINLAGCLEILPPMPVSEPASGAFCGKCESVCLASTGIDEI